MTCTETWKNDKDEIEMVKKHRQRTWTVNDILPVRELQVEDATSDNDLQQTEGHHAMDMSGNTMLNEQENTSPGKDILLEDQTTKEWTTNEEWNTDEETVAQCW